MDHEGRHRNLLLAGAALLGALALAPSSAPAQGTTAPVASAPRAATDPMQCPAGQGDDQPGTAPKSTSDGQSDETSKEATPPAYKLLRYEEDYSYLKDPSRRTDFWDPVKYIPLGGRKF